MEGREVFNNIAGYVYLILFVGSLIIYGFNSGDYKENSYFCAGYYEDDYVNSDQVDLLYWMQNGLCCHYALSEDRRIIQQCQV